MSDLRTARHEAMKRKPRILPEFQVRTKRPRAGFVPGRWDDVEVETWTIWCRRSDEEDDARRATTADLRRVGFVKRKARGGK